MKIETKHLICKSSSKKAFYRLCLFGDTVLKTSGSTIPYIKILDQKVFPFENADKAERFFNKKIKEKLQKNRKRTYEEILYNFDIKDSALVY